jgi:hypothetical protein
VIHAGAKVALQLLIVSPMHRISLDWARRQNLAPGSYKTVTESRSLKGVDRSFPVVLLDTSIRFTDSSVIPLLRQRFTNVRTESA